MVKGKWNPSNIKKVSDNTEDYKEASDYTYNFSKYGFSFKYPEAWIVDDKGIGYLYIGEYDGKINILVLYNKSTQKGYQQRAKAPGFLFSEYIANNCLSDVCLLIFKKKCTNRFHTFFV